MFGFTKVEIVRAVTAIVVLVGINLFINQTYTDVCTFEYGREYTLEYLNAPTSYVSATHKVIWRSNGCGNNLEDMYRIEVVPDSVAECKVIMVEEHGGPFFILKLPQHESRFCPAKPVTLTPVAR